MRADEALTMDVLKLDCAAACQRIKEGIRDGILGNLKKRGVVVALSGGIDSSVVGGLCVRALGRERVFGLMLPERVSSSATPGLSQLIVDHLEIEAEHHNITDMLTAAGCYRYRDEAIASVIREYTPEYKCKIVLPSLLEREHLRVFSVVVESPEGQQTRARLPLKAYLQIVAATNFKQRVRKMLEYFHADRLNYAVAGTPNRQEYDQGFFVKLGDGAADIKPIAHLYKTQVYQMAEYLGLPNEITTRPPTTDTYSLAQDQEEFYFSVPHDVLDLCLYAKDHDLPPQAVCQGLGLEPEQAERIFRDIDSKRKVAHYLHAPPLLVTEDATT